MDADQIEGPTRKTYVLVDGENIDATLGSSILGRRPRQPDLEDRATPRLAVDDDLSPALLDDAVRDGEA